MENVLSVAARRKHDTAAGLINVFVVLAHRFKDRLKVKIFKQIILERSNVTVDVVFTIQQIYLHKHLISCY